MNFAECLQCEAHIKLNNRPHIGQQIHCNECKTKFEVVNLHPLEFGPIEATTKLPPPQKNQKPVGFCPECEFNIKFGSPPREGVLVSCPKCKTKLEVVGLDPLELELSSHNAKRDTKKTTTKRRSERDWEENYIF